MALTIVQKMTFHCFPTGARRVRFSVCGMFQLSQGEDGGRGAGGEKIDKAGAFS